MRRLGSAYNLIIYGADLRDAGKYDCSGGTAYFLTVIGVPKCEGDAERLVEGVAAAFHCKVNISGGEGGGAAKGGRTEVATTGGRR